MEMGPAACTRNRHRQAPNLVRKSTVQQFFQNNFLFILLSIQCQLPEYFALSSLPSLSPLVFPNRLPFHSLVVTQLSFQYPVFQAADMPLFRCLLVTRRSIWVWVW